ncbi:MAG: hypothetical protein AB8D78_01690, partial [Akkermansiaceae bacterium]
HIEWQSVVGRTYFPRVSTDMVNWSYLPGEVFLGDGSVLQGVSFPPPLDQRVFVSFQFTDIPGAHDLNGDVDHDGFTLAQEQANGTDPTLFDAGGGGTGYPIGDPGHPSYQLPQSEEEQKNFDLIIIEKIPNQPREIRVVALDKNFNILAINGIVGGSYPLPLKLGPVDLEIELQLISVNSVVNDVVFHPLEFTKQRLPNTSGETEDLKHHRLLRIPAGQTLSDKARITGAIEGTDLERSLYPMIIEFYRPTSNIFKAVEWNLTKFERKIPYDETPIRVRVNGDDDNENNIKDYDDVMYYVDEDDLSEITLRSPYLTGGRPFIINKTKGIRIWGNAQKSSLVANSNETRVQTYLPGNQTETQYFVELTDLIDNGFIEFSYALWQPDGAGWAKEVVLRRFAIRAFKSCVIGFSGDQSAATDVPSTGASITIYPGLRVALLDNGVYDICESLYLDGYDVYYYNEAQFEPAPNHLTSEPYLKLKSSMFYNGISEHSMFGHSHGGGAVYRMSASLDHDNLSDFKVGGYIDAVVQGGLSSEDRWPVNADTAKNYYQTNGPLDGEPIPGNPNNLDLTNMPGMSHILIDDEAVVQDGMIQEVKAETVK